MVKSGPPTPLRDIDYEAIEDAVMETARGRWFLSEYARRNRNADTEVLLQAIRRLHDALIEKEEQANQAEQERAQAIAIAKAIEGAASENDAGVSENKFNEVRSSLFEMADAIAETRREIASMRPKVGDDSEIVAATEELDAIIATTEKATSTILGAGERIQEIAWTLREQGVEDETCDELDALATEIYTACSFQDLTGQRTQKVVKVLRFIETRITSMVGIWGLEELEAAVPVPMPDEGDDDRPDAHLLNGPQLDGRGSSQDEIDEMMIVGSQSEAYALITGADTGADTDTDTDTDTGALAEAGDLDVAPAGAVDTLPELKIDPLEIDPLEIDPLAPEAADEADTAALADTAGEAMADEDTSETEAAALASELAADPLAVDGIGDALAAVDAASDELEAADAHAIDAVASLKVVADNDGDDDGDETQSQAIAAADQPSGEESAELAAEAVDGEPSDQVTADAAETGNKTGDKVSDEASNEASNEAEGRANDHTADSSASGGPETLISADELADAIASAEPVEMPDAGASKSDVLSRLDELRKKALFS